MCPWSGHCGELALAKGVTFAMLAAFRNFVQYDAKRNRMSWIGGFKEVVDPVRGTRGDANRACAPSCRASGVLAR
jgi:hypothetical protein